MGGILHPDLGRFLEIFDLCLCQWLGNIDSDLLRSSGGLHAPDPVHTLRTPSGMHSGLGMSFCQTFKGGSELVIEDDQGVYVSEQGRRADGRQNADGRKPVKHLTHGKPFRYRQHRRPLALSITSTAPGPLARPEREIVGQHKRRPGAFSGRQ